MPGTLRKAGLNSLWTPYMIEAGLYADRLAPLIGCVGQTVE
jgi:hypothetical protein